MNRGVTLAAMLALLAGCGDPLSDVARLGDVELAAGAPVAAAIAAADETADAPGFWARLRAGEIPAQTDLAGDGPGADMAGAQAGGDDVAGAEQVAGGGGFWAQLGFGPRAGAAAENPPSATVTLAALATAGVAGDDAAVPPDAPAAADPADPAAADPADPAAADPAAADPATGAVPQEAPRRQSLFGPRVSAPTGPDATRVAPGTILPYGQIATVCGLSDSALGTVVEQASGYVVHDTAASSVAQRTHYITGFPDGCARQFTAALALFGDVGTHEVVRYMSGAAARPYSATDTAYEQLKADVCRVGAGEPCGPALDRLARRTVFITVYETFGTNPTWGDILLHDGAVLAVNFN